MIALVRSACASASIGTTTTSASAQRGVAARDASASRTVAVESIAALLPPPAITRGACPRRARSIRVSGRSNQFSLRVARGGVGDAPPLSPMTPAPGPKPSPDPIMRWLLVATLACIAGCALLLGFASSRLLTAVAIVLGGIAFVLVLCAAYYVVGRSEDRERAQRAGPDA
jgi:drug/metabolite transporter (DMT)-like permease